MQYELLEHSYAKKKMYGNEASKFYFRWNKKTVHVFLTLPAK